MSTVITHPPVDVVVLGQGVMGGDISVRLAKEGYKVVGLDKGPYWNYQTDFTINKYDEWGVQLLGKFDNPLPMTTNTIRNNANQMALPIRRYTTGQQTHAGFGVGGAAHHYGANFGRFSPWTYAISSNTVSSYGQTYLETAAPMGDIIDFPMTYTDYAPYYQSYEQEWGVTGTNQNPFYSGNYPLPPHPQTPLALSFQSAAESLGINNWPNPTAIASQPYVNQWGVQINACVYDGYCSCFSYPCETGAKGNSANRTIPAAVKAGLDLRPNSYAYRIDTDPTTHLATQVRYYDGAGNVNIQPATAFAVTMWGFFSPWMFMVSELGTNYNPATVTGTMGRGPHEPTGAPTRTASGTINIGQNNTVWAGNGAGGGWSTYDFADDYFDHSKVQTPYIGGTRITFGSYASSPGLIGIGGAGSAANIGSTYKGTKLNLTQVTKQSVSASSAGMQLPMTDHYFDLDPHYTDIYGDPLPRYTIDYAPNAANASNDSVRLWSPVVTKMGVNITTGAAVTPGNTHEASWGIHIRGGVRIGSDPTTSALNQWQQLWAGAVNIFAAGEDTEPIGSNTQTGGTHPAAVTAGVAAEGLKMYLTSPGLLS